MLAPTGWDWKEVAPHWNEVLLESYVSEAGDRKLFQQAGVAEFWTPEEMCDSLDGRIKLVEEGFLMLFSGTVVSVDGQLNYGREWTIRMIDPVLERKIEHTYHVVVLDEEILEP